MRGWRSAAGRQLDAQRFAGRAQQREALGLAHPAGAACQLQCELLQGTVVSGVEKMHKPNADIYELAMSRFGLSPESSVFLDDTAKNVAGARSAGMHAFRFVDADQARRDLESLGVRV